MSSFAAHFSDGPETWKNAKNPYEEFHEPINKVCLWNQNEHFSWWFLRCCKLRLKNLGSFYVFRSLFTIFCSQHKNFNHIDTFFLIGWTEKNIFFEKGGFFCYPICEEKIIWFIVLFAVYQDSWINQLFVRQWSLIWYGIGLKT